MNDDQARPFYICDTCGRPEGLPFDVGDSCPHACGGQLVLLEDTGLGILPYFSLELGDEFQ